MSDSDKVTINYLTVDLKNSRKISVGYVKDNEDDDSYWFEFTASDGHKTRLRLSEEAFETIIGLKPKVDLHRNVKSELVWRLVDEGQIQVDSSSDDAEPLASQ